MLFIKIFLAGIQHEYPPENKRQRSSIKLVLALKWFGLLLLSHWPACLYISDTKRDVKDKEFGDQEQKNYKNSYRVFLLKIQGIIPLRVE